MQALLIYMLLRLGEGERPDNNFDVALLSAMWVRKHLRSNISPTVLKALGGSVCTKFQDWQF